MSAAATIITPTYERPYFLERKLFHLQLQRCRFPVIILDSSGDQNAGRNRALVEQYGHDLSLDYRHLGTHAHFAHKLGVGIELVATSYAVYSFDDDFLNAEAVEKGVAFLEYDSRYASVTGPTLNFIKTPEMPAEISRLPMLGKDELFGDLDPYMRLKRFLAASRRRNPLFSVWRADLLKQMVPPVACTAWSKSNEYLFEHASIYAGPTYRLDDILEIRHADYTKTKYRVGGLPSFTNSFAHDILDESFRLRFAEMVELCVEYLRRSDNRDVELIRQIVIRNFLHQRLARERRLDEVGPLGMYEEPSGSASVLRRLQTVLRYAGRLTNPARLSRFSALYNLYGGKAAVAMLRIDPDLQYNYITLTSPNSPHYRFMSTVYKTLEQHPEPPGQ